MSDADPPRLMDDPAASEALRSALAAGRAELPSEAEIASLAARLGPLMGPGGGGGAIDPSSAAGPGLALKAAGVVIALAAAGGAVFLVASDPPPAPPSRERSPPAVEAGLERVDAAIPDGVDVPVEAPEAIDARPTEPRPRVEVDPEAELALIGAAQEALRTSPARALALTAEHRRRFGAGTLAQERELVAIEALVSLGRADEARRRALAFHRRWPSSAHRRRIDVLVPRE